MKKINEDIVELDLEPYIIDKLKSNNINSIRELCRLKRTDLKQMDFNNKELKLITIELQLLGLDLNKKV